MTNERQQPVDTTEPMQRAATAEWQPPVAMSGVPAPAARAATPPVEPEPTRGTGPASTRQVPPENSVTPNAQEPAAGYLAAASWSQVPPVDPAHQAGAEVPATAASWDQSAAVRPPRRRRWLRGAAAAAVGVALLGAGGVGGYALGTGSASAAAEQTADQSGTGELPESQFPADGQVPGDGQLPGGLPGGDGSGMPGPPGSEDGTQQDGTQQDGTQQEGAQQEGAQQDGTGST